jgi:hypothetical protein
LGGGGFFCIAGGWGGCEWSETARRPRLGSRAVDHLAAQPACQCMGAARVPPLAFGGRDDGVACHVPGVFPVRDGNDHDVTVLLRMSGKPIAQLPFGGDLDAFECWYRHLCIFLRCRARPVVGPRRVKSAMHVQRGRGRLAHHQPSTRSVAWVALRGPGAGGSPRRPWRSRSPRAHRAARGCPRWPRARRSDGRRPRGRNAGDRRRGCRNRTARRRL